MAAVEAPIDRHPRRAHAKRLKRWAIVLGAVAALFGLMALLRDPVVPRAPSTEAPAADTSGPRLPVVCLSRELLCVAPALPIGYPCSCVHPLRGTLRGTIAPMNEARAALDRSRFSRPLFDSSEFGGP